MTARRPHFGLRQTETEGVILDGLEMLALLAARNIRGRYVMARLHGLRSELALMMGPKATRAAERLTAQRRRRRRKGKPDLRVVK